MNFLGIFVTNNSAMSFYKVYMNRPFIRLRRGTYSKKASWRQKLSCLPLTSSIYDKYWKECRKLSFFSYFLACQCNGQARECNHKSGKCHCTTKGIIGDKCERCDIVNHYYGDPVKNSCYYDLAIDYQFTFNLSKNEDKHLRGINFKNTPTKTDVDVDFSITCSVSAKMNMTVKYTDHEGNNIEEQ